MAPSKDEAHQFAIMITSGMPPEEALPYFFPEEDPDIVRGELKRWMSSSEVKRATLLIQGKSWQDMTLDEKVHYSIDKHYAELAYFLYSHNYSTLSEGERKKADTARTVLEAKLAGMSGKMDALTQWFDDVKSGRVRLNVPSPQAGHH